MTTAKKTTAKKVAVTVTAKTTEKFTVQVNHAARIKSGEYAGLVGSVQAIDPEKNTALVVVSGVRNGENVDACLHMGPDDLEPNK